MATPASKEANHYKGECGVILANNPGGIQTHVRSKTHSQKLHYKKKSKQYINNAQMFQRQKNRNELSQSSSTSSCNEVPISCTPSQCITNASNDTSSPSCNIQHIC